jgi:Zn-finger protein
VTADAYPVLAESNGHRWIEPKSGEWQCCKDCGIIRRADDTNKPCKGKVRVELRQE